ncbi:RidA family protein [Puniceicoccales bacterium CK1056]|uniref:RidA family protein n=1 Tax=Oceanipulchritudo coccoides TaxID=2706888 RepID=A0A6B2M0S2_9BACT|nr:RidA family protein [Oceanipulchritudo coccoides]NDV61956.1 RidA family protein [Oceanipulchritudo coccoides]
MTPIERTLAEKGITLPDPPAPKGNYLPYRISGNQLILSGVLAVENGNIRYAGKVGDGQTVEEGYVAARLCALNALAAIKGALGSLDRVTQFLLVNGFVNAVPGFAESPQVINGASDFLVEVFGDAGKHARAAVAVTGLPLGSTVELQISVEFD